MTVFFDPRDIANANTQLCAPRDMQKSRWLVTFEDSTRGVAVFSDEGEARRFLARAETMGWNCFLWTLATRLPDSELAT